MREPVPEKGRRSDKDEVERAEDERLERMAVFMFKKEPSGLPSGAARHKNEFAERNSPFLVPGSSSGAVEVEVVIFSVNEIKSRANESLRKSPGPLSRCVRALFQFSSVRLFHTIMIAQQGTAWYNLNVDLQKRLQKEKDMKLNQKIEISVFGALVISAAIWALAVATSRLVDSFVSEGAESGDWSIDEKEYGTN